MATPTDAEVKAVVDTKRDTTPFIETAVLLVTETLSGSGLTQDRLDLITKYVAAHFVWITETFGLQDKQSGDMREGYHPRTQAKADSGLQTSLFGKQALLLDTSGTLAAIGANQGLKAKFTVYAQRQRLPWNTWWW